MKKTTAILSLTILFSCGNKSDTTQTEVQNMANEKTAEMTNGATNTPVTNVVSNYKKYDIKSGIITFETIMEMTALKLKSKRVLYFDDYGIKECEEIYKIDAATGKEVLDARNFVKDGYNYSFSLEYKNGAKTKAMGYGVAAQFNEQEASTMKNNQYKKIADEIICGKTCQGFSMVSASGNIKMYGWNRITIKTTLDNPESKLKSETTAIKIEENVAIPADKFEVPKEVVMKDM